ncbi:MAG: hypothetical protein K2M79_03150 [Muribaculaceae bacterium]|nr:hypothetical protein [Muribaculaceae bacterium]
MHKRFTYFIFIFLLAVGLTSCIEDSFTTSPSDVLTFGSDSLRLGPVYTAELSPTAKMTVHNRASKMLSVQSITVEGSDAQYVNLNVDGLAGREFTDVEIRPNDSIFIMMNARLPENGYDDARALDARVVFMTNGVRQTIPVAAKAQDLQRLDALTVSSDLTLRPGKPYRVTDSLVVATGATLTLEPGVRLLFHDKSEMVVRGTLRSMGTAQNPVVMTGDKLGNVVTDISFDIMSRQWEGLWFTPTSRSNTLQHTEIANTVYGVTIAGDGDGNSPDLELINCRLHNSADVVFAASQAHVEALGCEFAEGGNGLVYLDGGTALLNHCTLANNYLFAAIAGPALGFAENEAGIPTADVQVINSIIYGLGPDLSHWDLADSQVFVRNTLFKSDGKDDDHFINCLWDKDPLYFTVRNDYFFDYRLREGSPAISVADASLTDPRTATDRYGLTRGTTPDLGAYVFNPAPM